MCFSLKNKTKKLVVVQRSALSPHRKKGLIPWSAVRHQANKHKNLAACILLERALTRNQFACYFFKKTTLNSPSHSLRTLFGLRRHVASLAVRDPSSRGQGASARIPGAPRRPCANQSVPSSVSEWAQDVTRVSGRRAARSESERREPRAAHELRPCSAPVNNGNMQMV